MTDERRGGEERRGHADVCENHERNTVDLASLKSSLRSIKWVITLVFPAITLVLGSWLGMTYDTMQDTLAGIKADIAVVRSSTHQTQVALSSTQTEIKQTRREIDQIRNEIREHRQNTFDTTNGRQ